LASDASDGFTRAPFARPVGIHEGTAVGADYRFSPFTLAGVALAGGGTNFSVNGSDPSLLAEQAGFRQCLLSSARPQWCIRARFEPLAQTRRLVE
jgi:hypothetical protein